MTMDGNQLGLDIAAATRAVHSSIPSTPEISEAQVDAIWKAIGPKIIDEVKKAVVTVTITSGSSAGTATGTIA